MGLSPAHVVNAFQPLGVAALSADCGRSLQDNDIVVREFLQATSIPVWIKPNAGIPRCSATPWSTKPTQQHSPPMSLTTRGRVPGSSAAAAADPRTHRSDRAGARPVDLALSAVTGAARRDEAANSGPRVHDAEAEWSWSLGRHCSPVRLLSLDKASSWPSAIEAMLRLIRRLNNRRTRAATLRLGRQRRRALDRRRRDDAARTGLLRPQFHAPGLGRRSRPIGFGPTGGNTSRLVPE